MPSRRAFAPASLVLAHAGVTQRKIANRLGCSPSAVSMWLRGERGAHPDLLPAIRVLAGPDIATEVAEILGIDQ